MQQTLILDNIFLSSRFMPKILYISLMFISLCFMIVCEAFGGTPPFPESLFFDISDLKFHVRLFAPKIAPHGKVLFVHGLGGSTFSWRYAPEYLVLITVQWRLTQQIASLTFSIFSQRIYPQINIHFSYSSSGG